MKELKKFKSMQKDKDQLYILSRELMEIWEEELIFHRFYWEEVPKELKELKKFKSMQKEKDQMYILSHELMIYRDPSPSYPIF